MVLPAMPLHAIASLYGEAGLGRRLLIAIAAVEVPRARLTFHGIAFSEERRDWSPWG